jgi:hypothetical protein
LRYKTLTKTQLQTAKTHELMTLKECIEQELAQRLDEEKGDHTQAKEQLFYSGHTGHYQWEYVQCGNKDRCRKCKEGIKHGPYLYRYFYKNGKLKSEYIKLSDLAKHPEAPPRPV